MKRNSRSPWGLFVKGNVDILRSFAFILGIKRALEYVDFESFATFAVASK